VKAAAVAMRGNTVADPVAPTVNSDEGRLTGAILAALATLKLTDKQLAALLKMPASQLSRQKAGRDGNQLGVQRLDMLPDDIEGLFLDALLDELARRRGRVIATPASHMHHVAEAMRALSAAVDQLAVIQQPALPFERRKEQRP